MGRALFLVCTVVMLTGAMAANMTNQTIGRADEKVSLAEGQLIARQNAMSAINQASALMKADWENARQKGIISKKTVTAGGTSNTGLGTLWSSTSLDAARPGAIIVQGTGTYQSSPTQIDTVVVSRTMMLVSPLDAAVVAEAPTAVTTFSGSSFSITGQNTTPPSSSTTADVTLSKRGIKVSNGGLARIIGTALGSSRYNLVKGVDDDGEAIVNNSIYAGAFQMPLQAIYDEARLHPSRVTLTSSSYTSKTYGSATSPAIVVRNGDLTLGDGVKGYGMLVVTGDLIFRGTARWEGVVLVKQESDDLNVTLDNTAQIYGSLVMLQGSSSFTMPVDGRIKVRYVSSNAGLRSSVWVHPHGDSPTQYYAPGANGCGASPYEDFEQNFNAGQQMNFFIGVHRVTDTRGTSRCDDDRLTSEYYRHYARGHFAPTSGKPYGYVSQLDQFLYRIAFEDIDETIDSGYGKNPDWDYDKPGQEDQLIEVEIQCKNRNANGTVISGQWHKCTPEDPEANAVDQAWTAFGSSGGSVSSSVTGSTLYFTVKSSVDVYYSSEAITRLAPLMDTIRQMAQVVTVEQRTWASH